MKVVSLGLTRRSLALIAFETVVIVAAVMAATTLVTSSGSWSAFFESGGLTRALVIAAVYQACLYYVDLYRMHAASDWRGLLVGILRALASTSFVLAAIYFWFPSLIIGRGVFVIASFFVLMLIAAGRLAFEWWTRRVAPSERLLLVGTGQAAVSLARELFDRRQELGVEIVGFVDPNPARVGMPIINPGVIGTIEDIPSIVRGRGVDRVVVSLNEARGTLPMDQLLEMKLNGVTFDHLASVYEELTGKIAVENLRPSWLIFSSGFRKSRVLRAQKRAVDIVSALTGLLFGAPVMLAVALAVRISSSGRVLYRQQRVGLHGRIFTVYKFRSMRQDAEAGTGAVWAAVGDTRVTSIGRFLRRTRLDELPQLWNVLVGDMSLVGPRPERPEFVSQLTRQIPFYGQRHVCRPGLTGWAQVRYTYGSSVEDALEKLQYDLFYIKNLSISLDLFIIAATIKTVILQRGA